MKSNKEYMIEELERINDILSLKDWDNDYKVEVMDDCIDILYGCVDLDEIDDVELLSMKDFFINTDKILDDELSSSKKIELIRKNLKDLIGG